MSEERSYPHDYCLADFAGYGACILRPDHDGRHQDAHGYRFTGGKRPQRVTLRVIAHRDGRKVADNTTVYSKVEDVRLAETRCKNSAEAEGLHMVSRKSTESGVTMVFSDDENFRPMSNVKLGNLLKRLGTRSNWHVYVDGLYMGFSADRMTECVGRCIETPGVKFVDYAGNILFFATFG